MIGGTEGHTEKYIFRPVEEMFVIEEGKVILSDKVGEEIDREERNKYSLFPNIKGFQSAVLLQSSDGNYAFEITCLSEKTGEEKIIFND